VRKGLACCVQNGRMGASASFHYAMRELLVSVNPREYLLDVLSRLPALTNRQTADLTPRRWLAARNRAHAA